MLSLRFVVAYIALISVATAIKCYQQNIVETTKNKEKPKMITDCGSNINYCIKTEHYVDGMTNNEYGCGNSCRTTGCSSLLKDSTTCCCSNNLCNSSSKLSVLFTVIPVAFVKLLLI